MMQDLFLLVPSVALYGETWHVHIGTFIRDEEVVVVVECVWVVVEVGWGRWGRNEWDMCPPLFGLTE